MKHDMTLDEMSREKYGFREKTETDISKINTIQYGLTALYLLTVNKC